jgi:hypothetical protein
MHHLKPSRQHYYYLVFIHAFALCCAVFFYQSIVLQCALVIFILMNFCYCLHKRQYTTITTIQYINHTTWKLNHSIDVLLQGNSVLTKYIVVMHFKAVFTGIKYSVLIFPDMLSKADFKILRRQMKYGSL